MSKTKFEYFHNHGDEDGNNSLTVCFGDSNELDHIIVGCHDTEQDAIESVQRLNTILDEFARQSVEEYKAKIKKVFEQRPIMAPEDSSWQEGYIECFNDLEKQINGI